MNKKLLISNERLDAIEALSRGLIPQAIECLKRADPLDETIKQLESGDVAGSLEFLEQKIEEKISILDYLKVRANITKDQDEINLVEKYLKLKRESGSRGEFSFHPTESVAILPKDLVRAFYSTSTSGGYLAGTQIKTDLMEFKSRIPLFKLLGCTIVDDLKLGNKYSIPKETSPLTVYDVLEGSALGTVDDPEWAETLAVAPYMIYSMLDFSRKAIKLFSEQIMEMVKERMSDSIFSAIDTRLFYGVTASNQCEGLFYNSDLQKVSGASFTELTAYSMIKKVNEIEAPKENRFFVLNAALEETLKQRPYGTSGDRIIQDGKLCDEPYIQSEKISNGHIWYGCWNTIAVMLWPREIMADPFHSGSEGGVLLKQWQPYDCKARNIKWISMSDNVD